LATWESTVFPEPSAKLILNGRLAIVALAPSPRTTTLAGLISTEACAGAAAAGATASATRPSAHRLIVKA
jgi:hypothetical protein